MSQTDNNSEAHETILSHVPSGQVVEIVRCDAGYGLKSRLAAMGLMAGVELKVIQNGHPGPFVVLVKGTRMALGRGMADKIVVVEK